LFLWASIKRTKILVCRAAWSVLVWQTIRTSGHHYGGADVKVFFYPRGESAILVNTEIARAP
jgi:hypothetical protein